MDGIKMVVDFCYDTNKRALLKYFIHSSKSTEHNILSEG